MVVSFFVCRFVLKFINMAKYSNIQIGALADAFGKSVETIKRWIREENTIITSDKAKSALLKLKK